MFAKVNPDSRLPAALQNGTKQNILAQLAGAVLFFFGFTLFEAWEDRQYAKKNSRSK